MWFSIEVFDGSTSASLWAEAYSDMLMETALTRGALDWSWHRHTWGVVFEVSVPDDAWWEAFIASPVVRAALDAVPDPFTGVIIYRGRGGSAGAAEPRRPRPLAGAGSAALPLPWDLGFDEPVTLAALAGPAAPRLLQVGL
ncbi:MAG: hypothetical protein ACYC1D_09345 [Acidimicrobiales bacterium]